MTKEEAINILEEVSLIDDSMYQYNQWYCMALNMAIESLKTEAIPVWFIKRQIDGIENNGNKVYSEVFADYAVGYKALIKAWEGVMNE